MEEPRSRSLRQRLRMSVRGLMILVLALAAWLGWIAYRARVQHDAVAAIRRSGGYVAYDGEASDSGQSASGGLARPKRLVDLIGVDYRRNVAEVTLQQATDADLIPVGRLTRLDKLSIGSSTMTEIGLRHLRELTISKQLLFRYTPPPNSGWMDRSTPLGRICFARLAYDGDWNVNPLVIPHLMVAQRPQFSRGVLYHGGMLSTDPQMIYFPLVYMHGKGAFSLSPPDLAALRTHLDPGGGTIFADAACGSGAFDAAFRQFIAALLPNNRLVPILPNDELYSASVGADLSSVQLTSGAGGGNGFPQLEGVKIGDHWVIIYSKYGIGCAVERNHDIGCKGYTHDDAMTIWGNIFSYSTLP